MSRQAGDGDRLLGAGVLDHEGEGHIPAGLGHRRRVGGLGDLDRRQDVGEVDRGVVVVGGFGVVVVLGLAGEDVDVVGPGVVAFHPLGEGELAAGAGGQDGADLAVGVAGQGAVDRVGEAGDGHRLFGGGVLDHEGEDHIAAGLGHRGRVRRSW